MQTHTHRIILWPILSVVGLQSISEGENVSSVPHTMRDCTHTCNLQYIRSLTVSHVKAMNLPLLYLHVPSRVALRNVNLAYGDMIKERRKKSERLVVVDKREMKEQNEKQERRD